MTQHVYHVCPQCGRRWPCDRPITRTRTFEAEAPTFNNASSPWPNVQYEVYWSISKITNTFWKAVAFTIPATITAIAATKYWDWPVSIPEMVFVASFVGSLRLFGRVPSWHNAVSQTQPPDTPEIEPEPEDTRKFIGWESETHTKTTQHIEWYAPPVPIRQMQSYALALVNNRFDWIDERDLSNHKANISQLNYRKLRRDWLSRDWCTETGDRKTAIVNKTMIRRIAFDNPK